MTLKSSYRASEWSEEAENSSWNNVFLASLALAESTNVGAMKQKSMYGMKVVSPPLTFIHPDQTHDERDTLGAEHTCCSTVTIFNQ